MPNTDSPVSQEKTSRDAFVGASLRSLALTGDRWLAEAKASPAFVGEARAASELGIHPQCSRMDLFSLLLAVILIYMVLASQFASFIHPVTIMLSVPLSIGGALGALALTGLTLNIYSMIGMVMLMGLVTKNAILLVDYTNQLRRECGMETKAALLMAGPVRLRPILMTAFSTIAGMIPIAIGLGAGSETRQPMGACVIGGMLTSTLLTLVVIPVVYSLLDDVGGTVRRWLGGTDQQQGAGPPLHVVEEIEELREEKCGVPVAARSRDAVRAS